jgi:hypothetical protein
MLSAEARLRPPPPTHPDRDRLFLLGCSADFELPIRLAPEYHRRYNANLLQKIIIENCALIVAIWLRPAIGP